MANAHQPSLEALNPTSVVRDLCNSLIGYCDADKLAQAQDDRDRITLLLGNGAIVKQVQDCVRNQLNNEINRYEKSKTKALSFKEAGNGAFGKGKYVEALDLYTKSIAWMPSDETKAIPNDSKLKFPGTLETSEQSPCPAVIFVHCELQHKLHERSGRAFIGEGKGTEAMQQFRQALTALQNASIDENKAAKTKKTLEDLIKSSSRSKTDHSYISGDTKEAEENIIPELGSGASRMLRAASSKLTLRSTEKEGRFICANQDIQPGEVILVQQAYVSCLSPEFYHKQCYLCFTPTLVPIPCRHCIWVSFCSEKCLNRSWNLYHKHECKILGVLASAGVSITCYMALRLVFQTGLEQVNKWMELLYKTGEKDESSKDNKEVNKKTGGGTTAQVLGGSTELNPNEQYRADHISLFQLVTHSSRRGFEDIFHRTIMALYVLQLVKETEFMSTGPQRRGEAAGTNLKENNDGKNSREDGKVGYMNEDEVAVGTILLRSLQFLQFNAHEVAGWDTEQSKSIFLGGGLFLTLALFNHSCNPAIVRYFVNDTVVVRAVRTIYRGEQVTENYGPLFTGSTRKERRTTLENQYWFECQCICCREDWPTFENMELDSFRFRCSFCHSFLGKSNEEASMGLLLECRKCSRPTNILKSLKDLQASEGKYNKALELLEKGREQTALGILLQNISLFDSILLPPFRDYHLCQEAVRKCFLTLGNKTHTQISS
ncbi:unnamed protein product [Allacma fusca]|uniref:Protein-lysine N-methyltransferase SMYD4 n=1 Tax=Allacma fusca TaxID=39272 RepID=A0A8J2PLD8_9HEXA|nr:unnamed protein product [Allacma fusca]